MWEPETWYRAGTVPFELREISDIDSLSWRANDPTGSWKAGQLRVLRSGFVNAGERGIGLLSSQ